MTHPAEHSEGTSDAEQNRGARPGGEAAGGSTPPLNDIPDADAARREMRALGFGDHKGSSID